MLLFLKGVGGIFVFPFASPFVASFCLLPFYSLHFWTLPHHLPSIFNLPASACILLTCVLPLPRIFRAIFKPTGISFKVIMLLIWSPERWSQGVSKQNLNRYLICEIFCQSLIRWILICNGGSSTMPTPTPIIPRYFYCCFCKDTDYW